MTAPTIHIEGDHLYLTWSDRQLRFEYSIAGFAKALDHVPQVSPKWIPTPRRSNFPPPEPISGRIARQSKPFKTTRIPIPAGVRETALTIVKGMKK